MKKREKRACCQRLYCRCIKRILDIVFSLLLLVFMLLPMAIVALLIAVESSGGPFFMQRRVGRGGSEFTCIKFRTMYRDAPKHMPATRFENKDKYITHMGKHLRRSGFDELPQLFNVLLGQMSIVGPRPLISEEQELHAMRESQGVYALRPGITGMAQVSGRNSLSDGEKLTKDRYYLDNIKIWLDIKIIFKTLFEVTHSPDEKEA